MLVSQSEPLIESFGRDSAAAWTGYANPYGLEATLILNSLGTEIYHKIKFDHPTS